MLLPQEIRNRQFSRAIRGYATVEVDEYIHFLADTVDALHRENAELDQKLTISLEKLAELQAREARIARLDTEMRRAAATLLHEAEKQQKKILEEAHAYADRVIAEADAHLAIQKKVREEIREEVLRFKNELYARYGQHIDQLEEIASAAEKTAFEDAPARPATTTPVVELAEAEEVIAPPAYTAPEAVAEEIEAVTEVEEIPEVMEEIPEVADEIETHSADEMEQMNLFDPLDDTEAINKELEEMMAGTEEIWTDYTDVVAEEEIDPGFALPTPEEDEEVPEEAFLAAPEAPVEEEPEVPAEEDDALLLQNLRRAFSVEFDTFEKSKSTKKAAAEDADEFSFVENEPPKKRGFLSRLIGGDSDGE